jgi:hypothetical protein
MRRFERRHGIVGTDGTGKATYKTVGRGSGFQGLLLDLLMSGDHTQTGFLVGRLFLQTYHMPPGCGKESV